MAKRKGISKKTRFEVFKRDSFTCQYCGRSAPEVILHLDHIQPVSKDGEDDILNLLTSCFDCNMGKKDRLLSDDSVIAKQKAQLDELNERREQLEMMLEWRKGLQNLNDASVDAAVARWDEEETGWLVNDNGRGTFKTLIRKHGLNTVLEAIEMTFEKHLKRETDGSVTAVTISDVMDIIPKTCRWLDKPEWQRDLFYIRGIIRNRVQWYYDHAECYAWLENAYEDGVPIEKLKSIAYTVTRWDELAERLIEARKQHRG